jgi:Tfp pilus assembly protein PilX
MNIGAKTIRIASILKEARRASFLKSACAGENGAALPVALILLAIVSLLGGAAIMTTGKDIKIAGNDKVSKEAFYSAGAALEEARGRLKGPSSAPSYVGDPASPTNPWWSAYLVTSNSWQTSDDPNYNALYTNYIPTTSSHTNTTVTANSLQAGLSYWTKIRHKREYDAEQKGHTTSTPHYFDNDGNLGTNPVSAPGNIIYYGYGDPALPTTVMQFTTAGATIHKPVDILRAYGASGTSSQVTEIEVVQRPGPPIVSTLYAKGNVTINGTSASLDGNDNCGIAPALPPVYTKDPAVTNVSGSPVFDGNPPNPDHGTLDIDIVGYVNSLKSGAIVVTSDQNGTNYGSATDYVTVYSDTSNPFNVGGLKFQNVVGYGILLVDGDLELGGNVDWNGILLVTGALTFNGGGNPINIRGTAMADVAAVDINGGLDLRYDQCEIDNALHARPLMVLSWRHLF